MKPKQLSELISTILGNGGDFPPLFVFGGPGVGKSSICRQAAAVHGYKVHDIRALLRDPVDFVGIPVPFAVLSNGKRLPLSSIGIEVDVERYVVEWLAPSFLPPQGSKEKHLILLDELLLAPTMTTNALLQLVLDRQLGEYKLPDNAYIVALSNRPDEAIGVHKLSPPLRRRFVVVTLEPCLEHWSQWAVTAGVNPVIIGFLQRRPELLYKFSQSHPFPNPASWEFVSKILSTVQNVNLELISGCIGEGAATEFLSFYNIQVNLPEMKDILYGRVDYTPQDVDTTYVVCCGVVHVANSQEEFDMAIMYATRLQPEYSVFMLKLLFTKNRLLCIRSKNWERVSGILTEMGVI